MLRLVSHGRTPSLVARSRLLSSSSDVDILESSVTVDGDSQHASTSTAAYKKARRTELKRRQHGQTFVDNLIITVRSGKGGDGCVSFHRDKLTPKGPPSGGNGGRGGDVYIIPSSSMLSLSSVTKEVRALTGGRGQGDWNNGRNAPHTIIKVPLGTIVRQIVGNDPRRSPDQYEALEESLGNLTQEQYFRAARDRRWLHYQDYADENLLKEEFTQADRDLYKEEKMRRWSWRQREPIELDLAMPEEKVLDVDGPLAKGGPEYLGHLLARGGKGGLGNPNFFSATYRSPKFASRGQSEERITLHLELKILSDVGLVGMPNAGKSTILRALTGGRAKTEIAGYAFTTLNPIVGVIRVAQDGNYEGSSSEGAVYNETKLENSLEHNRMVGGDFAHSLTRNQGQSVSELTSVKSTGHKFDIFETFRFTIADNPGLIAGASENVGLGHSFLRSMERALCLVYVVDLAADAPWDELRDLQTELEAYKIGMSAKARMVIANKADLLAGEGNSVEEAKNKLHRLEQFVREEMLLPGGKVMDVVPVSAKHAQNLTKVVGLMKVHVEEARQLRASEPQMPP